MRTGARVTGELTRLTDRPSVDQHPHITPDGKTLVFSRLTDSWDIWMKELRTGKETPLIATSLEEAMPRISPDGTKVVSAEPDPPSDEEGLRLTLEGSPVLVGGPEVKSLPDEVGHADLVRLEAR